MARKEKVVVAKRGCTCCGTGCVLIAGIVPLSIVGVWEMLGAFAALALWPAILVSGASASRVVRQRKERPRRSPCR